MRLTYLPQRVACLLVFILAAPGLGLAERLQQGDYLQDSLMDALRRTKSPLQALGRPTDIPRSVHVEADGNAQQLNENINWHEACWMLTLLPDGGRQSGDCSELPALKVTSREHFELRFPGSNNMPMGYSFVGDEQEAVRRIVLGGSYRDLHGREVHFDAGGVVRGLGPDSKYDLQMDYVIGPDFDYFVLGKDIKKAIAFRRRGRSLILYGVGPPDPEDPQSIGRPDWAHPISELAPVE